MAEELSEMGDTIVVKGAVITPFETITEGAVIVSNGRIEYVGVWDEASGRVYDFGDNYVSPGFVDLHVHGGAGFDVMDASERAITKLSEHLVVGGVTSFLPTTCSSPPQDLLAVARAVKASVGRSGKGAEILGLHLEGPYLNSKRRGAHSAAYIRPPSIDEFSEVQSEADGGVRIITLAPEAEGAMELAEEFSSSGGILSAGHTDATYEEMEIAVEAGFRHVTHLFNAMRPFHHRDPGVVGAALADERITVDIIADGQHLHPAALRLVAMTKGAGKTALVSDSIKPAGLPDGEYRLGDQIVRLKDARCTLGSGVLAGSTIRLCDAVRNMVKLARVPLADAVEMASSTPASIIGASDRKGCLKPGMDADLTVLDRDYSVLLTIVGGKVVYEKV